MTSPGNESRCFIPAVILCLGLVTAQIIATIQVYLANIDFHQALSLLDGQGYLTVPSPRIADRLLAFAPAFVGGLFFTCSIGAGFSLFTLGATWSWDRIFNRQRSVAAVFGLLWLACMMGVNTRGFSPLVTLHVVAIPALVSVASLKWLDRTTRPKHRSKAWRHGIPIAVLALLWSSQLSGSLFLDIRDNVLFSSAWGRAFNDMYYEYTLYPARVFKSLDQRMLKTTSLSGIGEESKARALQRILRNRDYLQVPDGSEADLAIVQGPNDLVFYHRQRPVLRTTQTAFLSHPIEDLKLFSAKTDRHGLFRQLTFVSLLLGFPLALYLFLFALLRFICSLGMNTRVASVTSSVLCFLIGLSLFFLLQLNNRNPTDRENIPAALASEDWQENVAALKTIYNEKVRLEGPSALLKLLEAPRIPVRYWLAKALATNPGSGTANPLTLLLDDPNPNVVCMALASLGRQGNRSAIGTILNVIETSDHWYVQGYAYRALRRLGWTQAESK